MARIELHEDNAGGLYLWCEEKGYGYAGLEYVKGANLMEDAAGKCLPVSSLHVGKWFSTQSK
jgi:hypothetical protein